MDILAESWETMQISTKGRYALRIMLYLADRYTLECVSAKHIAEEEKLSVKYLEHIMSQLSKNGFVVSEKGAAGGYRLAEAPENFSVGQIVRTMESDFTLVPCLNQQQSPCPQYDTCTTVEVWKLLQETIDELMDNLTLLDLLRMQQEKLDKPSLYLTYLLHQNNRNE